MRKMVFLLVIVVILTSCGNTKLLEKPAPRISVDYSGAEAMLKILKTAREGQLERQSLEKVLDMEGYKHYLSHLNLNRFFKNI